MITFQDRLNVANLGLCAYCPEDAIAAWECPGEFDPLLPVCPNHRNGPPNIVSPLQLAEIIERIRAGMLK